MEKPDAPAVICKLLIRGLSRWSAYALRYGPPHLVGSRCQVLNRAVGGMPNSAHCIGYASDRPRQRPHGRLPRLLLQIPGRPPLGSVDLREGVRARGPKGELRRQFPVLQPGCRSRSQHWRSSRKKAVRRIPGRLSCLNGPRRAELLRLSEVDGDQPVAVLPLFFGETQIVRYGGVIEPGRYREG